MVTFATNCRWLLTVICGRIKATPKVLPCTNKWIWMRHLCIRYNISDVYSIFFFIIMRNGRFICFNAQQPIVRYLREDFGSFCCCYSSTEVMMITIRLEPSAYVPGESVNLDLETKNDSNVSVTNFRIQLIKVKLVFYYNLLH